MLPVGRNVTLLHKRVGTQIGFHWPAGRLQVAIVFLNDAHQFKQILQQFSKHILTIKFRNITKFMTIHFMVPNKGV
jgi:hypothetical protein